jgi:uncharacterized protein YndB with AHSA1/START domain
VPGADEPTPGDDPGDETCVVITAPAAVPPEQVWHTLVERSAEWWGEPYLPPGSGTMRIEARLGGRVWAEGGRGEPAGDLHGTVRAFDPPERLEVGGVLIPGAYAGSVTVTVERTSLGSEVRVEQMARGRIDAAVEERISTGWARLLARLTELAER